MATAATVAAVVLLALAAAKVAWARAGERLAAILAEDEERTR